MTGAAPAGGGAGVADVGAHDLEDPGVVADDQIKMALVQLPALRLCAADGGVNATIRQPKTWIGDPMMKLQR